MKGTLLDTNSLESRTDEQSSRGRSIIGLISALVIVSLVCAGYLLLRKKHAEQTLQAAQAAQTPELKPKGPPKLQVLVDDAMLKGEETLIGGTVKNISNENLNSVAVELELIRRKGNTTEKTSVQVTPSQLSPQAEGRYSLSLRSAEYGGVKLIGLREGAAANSLVFIAGQGLKRPLEKFETKTIIVKRPSTPNDGFINTPDTPSRVP